MTISNLYDYFYNFLPSQDPKKYYVTEDLTFAPCKTQKDTNQKGIIALQQLIDRKTLDEEEAKEVTFIACVLESMVKGIDPELRVLSQVNQLRKLIKSQPRNVQDIWLKTYEAYKSLYFTSTKDTIIELSKAIVSSEMLFKAVYIKQKSQPLTLPDELYVLIFSQLGVQELSCLKLTCKHFRSLSNDSTIQKKIFKKETGVVPRYDKDLLRAHKVRCFAVRRSALAITPLLESSEWLSQYSLSFSKDHLLISDQMKRYIHLYDVKTKERKHWGIKPHFLAKLYGNDFFTITRDGLISKYSASSFQSTWEIETDDKKITDFSIENDCITLYSTDQVTKIDIKTKRVLEKTPVMLFPYVNNTISGSGWIVANDLNDYAPLTIKYPSTCPVPDSVGCIPHLIQKNLVYTVVKNSSIIKVFDLNTLKLINTINTSANRVITLAEHNGILFVGNSTHIYVIDVLTKKQIKEIYCKDVYNLWANENTLIVQTYAGIFYIELPDA